MKFTDLPPSITSPTPPLSMTSPKPPLNTLTTFPPYVPLDHLGRIRSQLRQLGSPEHLITTKWRRFSNSPSFPTENGSVVSGYAGNTPTSSHSKPIDMTCTMRASNSGNLAKNTNDLRCKTKDTPTNTGYTHATQPNCSSFNYVTYKLQECGGERLTNYTGQHFRQCKSKPTQGTVHESASYMPFGDAWYSPPLPTPQAHTCTLHPQIVNNQQIDVNNPPAQ